MNDIFIDISDKDFLPSIQDIIRLFFPDPVIYTDFTALPEKEGIYIQVIIENTDSITVSAYLKRGKHVCTQQEDTISPPADRKNETKRIIRLALFHLLTQFTGKRPNPWGIFTGIRPTKIIHRMLDQGYSNIEIFKKLTADYSLSENKASQVIEVALHQRKFLLTKQEAAKLVSVYIGIPFCPTRCLYCSFPSYPIKKFKNWVSPFLEALKQEIIDVGRTIKENGLKVQAIYLGGGTPTCINAKQLEELLELINKYLQCSKTTEITIEGGRPDTLSTKILKVCAKAGVNRISINPQTMQEKTLGIIGRSHSIDDIYRAVDRARNLDLPVINMDLIIGLPGENLSDVEKTLDLIKPLKPENLTVHALAIKKASILRHELNQHSIPRKEEAVEMWENTREHALSMGQTPYYMYRQKNIVGDLENIGYALPGKECIYNIQMIEERQTIIGLGAGAGSKWVQPKNWLLTNKYNPKDPLMYIERLEELIEWKLDKIIELNN